MPPPGELRAFSRCLGELLQVWGHSSVRVLDLLPLLRVSLAAPGGGCGAVAFLLHEGLWSPEL